MRPVASALFRRASGVVAASCLALLLLAAGSATAQPVPLPDAPGGPAEREILNPERLERLADRLGLGAAKLRVLKERLYDAQQERIRLKAQLDVARLRLRRLLDQDAPDEPAVMAAVERLGQLRTDLHKQQLKLLLRIRAELTIEQRRALKSLLGDLEDRRRRHRKNRKRHRQR